MNLGNIVSMATSIKWTVTEASTSLISNLLFMFKLIIHFVSYILLNQVFIFKKN